MVLQSNEGERGLCILTEREPERVDRGLVRGGGRERLGVRLGEHDRHDLL